jgi:ribosomal protein S18 acetylase RimI-like enzyme
MQDRGTAEVPPVPYGWRRAAAAGLTFRPIADADLPFLSGLYASTRADELAVVAWSEDEKSAFLHAQFQAQHAHYQAHYSAADFLVILHGGDAIGRLYIDRWPQEHRIVDIALLPAHRGQGLGTALLLDLLDEAARVGKATSVHVERFNPAQRLYRRLGFAVVGEHGVYELLRWTPSAQSAGNR